MADYKIDTSANASLPPVDPTKDSQARQKDRKTPNNVGAMSGPLSRLQRKAQKVAAKNTAATASPNRLSQKPSADTPATSSAPTKRSPTRDANYVRNMRQKRQAFESVQAHDKYAQAPGAIAPEAYGKNAAATAQSSANNSSGLSREAFSDVACNPLAAVRLPAPSVQWNTSPEMMACLKKMKILTGAVVQGTAAPAHAAGVADEVARPQAVNATALLADNATPLDATHLVEIKQLAGTVPQVQQAADGKVIITPMSWLAFGTKLRQDQLQAMLVWTLMHQMASATDALIASGTAQVGVMQAHEQILNEQSTQLLSLSQNVVQARNQWLEGPLRGVIGASAFLDAGAMDRNQIVQQDAMALPTMLADSSHFINRVSGAEKLSAPGKMTYAAEAQRGADGGQAPDNRVLSSYSYTDKEGKAVSVGIARTYLTDEEANGLSARNRASWESIEVRFQSETIHKAFTISDRASTFLTEKKALELALRDIRHLKATGHQIHQPSASGEDIEQALMRRIAAMDQKYQKERYQFDLQGAQVMRRTNATSDLMTKRNSLGQEIAAVEAQRATFTINLGEDEQSTAKAIMQREMLDKKLFFLQNHARLIDNVIKRGFHSPGVNRGGSTEPGAAGVVADYHQLRNDIYAIKQAIGLKGQSVADSDKLIKKLHQAEQQLKHMREYDQANTLPINDLAYMFVSGRTPQDVSIVGAEGLNKDGMPLRPVAQDQVMAYVNTLTPAQKEVLFNSVTAHQMQRFFNGRNEGGIEGSLAAANRRDDKTAEEQQSKQRLINSLTAEQQAIAACKEFFLGQAPQLFKSSAIASETFGGPLRNWDPLGLGAPIKSWPLSIGLRQTSPKPSAQNANTRAHTQRGQNSNNGGPSTSAEDDTIYALPPVGSTSSILTHMNENLRPGVKAGNSLHGNLGKGQTGGVFKDVAWEKMNVLINAASSINFNQLYQEQSQGVMSQVMASSQMALEDHQMAFDKISELHQLISSLVQQTLSATYAMPR